MARGPACGSLPPTEHALCGLIPLPVAGALHCPRDPTGSPASRTAAAKVLGFCAQHMAQQQVQESVTHSTACEVHDRVTSISRSFACCILSWPQQTVALPFSPYAPIQTRMYACAHASRSTASRGLRWECAPPLPRLLRPPPLPPPPCIAPCLSWSRGCRRMKPSTSNPRSLLTALRCATSALHSDAEAALHCCLHHLRPPLDPPLPLLPPPLRNRC